MIYIGKILNAEEIDEQNLLLAIEFTILTRAALENVLSYFRCAL